MGEPLLPRFTLGTHRLVSPEQTLRRIAPAIERCGITRIAEITGLDEDLGVPTFCAIRPQGVVLQTGNGKGLTPAAARASAAMEAIELHHAEHPEPQRLVRASARQLRRRGLDVRVPERDDADQGFFFSPDYVIDWVQCEELQSGAEPWIPASAAYFLEPTIYRANTNGLASGNHIVEATLHGLYELIERDAISRVVVGDVLDIRGRCRVVDVETIDVEPLRGIVEKIAAAQSQLVLLWVPAQAPVHVLWAVLLNHQPHRAATALTLGAGAHPELEVAAARAITEAVQSRLTIIQAARDDVIERPSFGRDELRPGVAFRYFEGLSADTRWGELRNMQPTGATLDPDLGRRLDRLLTALADAGHDAVHRVNLLRPEIDVPVVKVLVPSLSFQRRLF